MLTGSEIVREVESGNITIIPFDKQAVNPNSINLTLGKTLFVLEGELDMRLPCRYREVTIPPEGYRLVPGEAYLGSTVEYIGTDKFGSTYCGRSSTGRLFIKSQIDAGHVDVGFHGHLTLEIEVTRPCRIYAGVHIGQWILYALTGDIDMLYSSVGNYTGQTTPVPSKMWKSFLVDKE